MAHKIRVLIIDDHPLFRQGIRWSLEEVGDMEVVGEAENGQEAIKLAERLLPDVVLVDINLPGLNGLEVARVIKRRDPRIGMIVLSVYEDDDQLFQAIKVGAAAYSSKDVHPNALLTMIREVARGRYLINESVLAKPHVATRVLHQFRELASTEDEQTTALFAPLTSREIEILDCIARGLSNKEIANELSISGQTVKNHITSILSKLQVNDRTMAVIYAIQKGWIRMGYDPAKGFRRLNLPIRSAVSGGTTSFLYEPLEISDGSVPTEKCMSLLSDVSAAVPDPLHLAILHQSALPESPTHIAFERLARLAARLLHVPEAVVSLVDVDRQFLLSSPSLAKPSGAQRKTPLSHSFCQYVVASSEPFIVTDARLHPFLADNPILSGLGVVAYLGFPLILSDGFVLGSFCVTDTVPHAWDETDIMTLRDLTAAVITEIELRRDMLVRQRMEIALAESNARFTSAFADAAIGMALVAPDGRWLQVNQSLCALVGYSEHELLNMDFQAITHLADLDSDLGYVQEMLIGARTTYQMEKRYFHRQGYVIWVLLNVSLVRTVDGTPRYFVSQIQDITARKQGEWEREHLIEQLREAVESVEVLQGLLPICAWCKKIRDDQGYWNQIEVYIQQHTAAEFSHGICPDCVQRIYSDSIDTTE